MKKFALETNLYLFGEGGGAAAGGDGGTGAGEGTAEGAQVQAPVYTSKRGKANPLANVQYGKQAEDPAAQEEPAKETETQATANTDAEKRAAFDAFMADPYNKNLYNQNVQNQINRRFKNNADIEAELNETRDLLKMQRMKYGVQTNAELKAAIEADKSFYEEAANAAGMTVEQFKYMESLKEQVAQYETERRAAEAQQKLQEDAARWMQQAQRVQQMYPNFNLEHELTNQETGERFTGLLRSGNVDVLTAYQVIHMDELLPGAIAQAVQTTQQKTINNIRARGMRPAENGAGGQAAATIVKKDPSTWTKADRKEINRRVMRGEVIEL